MGPKPITSKVVPAMTGAANLIVQRQSPRDTAYSLSQAGLCLLDQTLGQRAGKRARIQYSHPGHNTLAKFCSCRSLVIQYHKTTLHLDNEPLP